LSTITDLFNLKIGLGRKGVFIEKLGSNTTVLLADEKFPLKESAQIKRYTVETVEEILTSEGITKENVYYIIPPSLYYRNIVRFPFTDTQKIEGVIKYEVQDYLPFQDIDCVTDFLPLSVEDSGQEVLSFSAEKSEIENILWSFGQYRKNLKSLIPFDIAVYNNVVSTVEKDTFIFLDIQNDSVYIQFVKKGMISSMISIIRNDDELYMDSFLSHLLMFLRETDYPPVYVNIRSTASEDFRDLNHKVFELMDLSYRAFPIRAYGSYITEDNSLELSEMISIFGALKSINLVQSTKVDLLKEEFKPRLKGYLSMKDFIALGIIMLILLSISVSNLFIDVRIHKKKIKELEKSISGLSSSIFGKPQLKKEESEQLLADIRTKIVDIEKSIDRKYSGVELLREISTYLPGDIVVEYTDIVIEKDRVKFAGKARTFSDIDRMQEALSFSEYISEVKVSNTGTTGSTGGFAVTFVFDIKVRTE
jgi:hypothetical protein